MTRNRSSPSLQLCTPSKHLADQSQTNLLASCPVCLYSLPSLPVHYNRGKTTLHLSQISYRHSSLRHSPLESPRTLSSSYIGSDVTSRSGALQLKKVLFTKSGSLYNYLRKKIQVNICVANLYCKKNIFAEN